VTTTIPCAAGTLAVTYEYVHRHWRIGVALPAGCVISATAQRLADVEPTIRAELGRRLAMEPEEIDLEFRHITEPDTRDGVDNSRLLTPAEVADIFRVDPKTISRWAKSGHLSVLRTAGGHRRFPAKAVEQLLRDDDGERRRPTRA
jgi:excisionase family DNA binding protein